MVKICENTIEMVKIELYSNGDKNSYQVIKMTNVNTGESLERKSIAPVDFYTIATAIMSEEYLCEFINYVWTTWSSGVLEDMIEELCNDEGDY